MKRAILYTFLLISSLSADLFDQVKPALNKPETSSSLRGIDYIYLINLDQRPEKWESSINQLRLYGIEPYRFSAVNGWELTGEQINDVGLKYTPFMDGDFMATSYPVDGPLEPIHSLITNFGQTYFAHCMARGTIGCALSHISVLKDAYDSGYETIWVMEDDIDILKDPRMVPDLIDGLDNVVGKGNWDILFTDRDIRDQEGNHRSTIWAARRPDYSVYSNQTNFTENRAVSNDFRKIGARYGTTSMIIRRSGMKKLLQFYANHSIYLPIDLDMIFPRNIKLYTVMEDVVSNQPKAASDNGSPNYKNNQTGTP